MCKLENSLEPKRETVGIATRIMDRPRLVVFGDDWGRHPSTIQHLVRGLLPHYRVDWVNTIGTRQPQLTLADLKRGLEKLFSWVSPRIELPCPNSTTLMVHSPMHWPSFQRPWERRLNRALLSHSLKGVLDGPTPPTAVITTTAITADLAAEYRTLNWIYFCSDDFPEWPDLDSKTLLAMEIDLLRYMRATVVVSENLQRRFHSMGYDSSVVTAGVDLEMWSKIVRKPSPLTDARPVATFWGMADPRLDDAVCEAIADKCELIIVGPKARVPQSLLEHPSIHWRGAVPHAQLPEIACETDVLVMPYRMMPATMAMQPLKMKEYLATGLPVVATPLPAALAWGDAMDILDDPVAFARRVVERARAPLPRSQTMARKRLENEGWAAKSKALENVFLKARFSHEPKTAQPART